MVFPEGVPVHMVEKVDGRPSAGPRAAQRREGPAAEPQPASSIAEGGLTSEADEIEEQARNSRMPEAGENLISTSSSERNGPATLDGAG
jgi:hypothetical protein